VRELQPDAVIAITGPDVRWVGNEAGVARADEWSVLPLPQEAPGAFENDRDSWRSLWALREQNQERDLGSRGRLADGKALCWWPAETDVSIRPGWFWHASENGRVKPLATLLDYWFAAVGGNAVLLLNVPPDRRGRLAAPDIAVLKDLGRYLDATFANDLAASGESKRYAKVGEVYFETPTTVDLFDLAEDVAASGQRVERFRIEVRQNGGWRECARGTTIGCRRLVRSEPITGDGFRYWIEQSRGAPAIARFALYRRPVVERPPVVRRAADGTVTIDGHGQPVRYTVDGAPVTAAATVYDEPFALPDGGVVRARAFPANGGPELRLETAGEAAATFGLAPAGFRIVGCSSEQGGREGAASAIDGDPKTHWHTRWSPDAPQPPHWLVVDLGRSVEAFGFTYLPRRDGDNGTIADYELFGSADGESWTLLSRGALAARPGAGQVVVRFEQVARELRFVKLVALREVHERAWASCAELSVLVR
jgi:alpha-L-fucosidase